MIGSPWRCRLRDAGDLLHRPHDRHLRPARRDARARSVPCGCEGSRLPITWNRRRIRHRRCLSSGLSGCAADGVRRHRVGRTRRPRSDAGPPGITCRGGPWVGHLVMLDASTSGRSPPPKTARRTSRSPKPSSSTSPSPAAFSRSTTPRPDPPRTSNARARCTLQQLPGSAAGDSGYSGDDGRRRCHHRPERRDRHLTRRRRPTPR
jgi:hypothetical protein